METKDIIIIGGGAAGLMASCAAAHVLKKRGSVLVLEGNAKLGRKLLATGNGRCNLTNLNVSPAHYHGDVTAIQDLLHEYTPKAICAVFREMGLVTKSDSEGRVYPQNQQAAAVLSALRWDAEKYGVSFSEEHTVSKIEKVKNGFTLICTDGTQLFTKQCILTCGGAASPAPFLRRGLHARKAARPHGDKAVPVFNAAYRARKAVENAFRHARPCKRRAFGGQ